MTIGIGTRKLLDILITRISACLTGVKVKVSTWIRRQLRVWPLDKFLDSDSDMFHRGDYKSLAMLVRIYLTGDIHQFRFAKPIKTSHARFLQRGIYYMTSELLSWQLELDFVTEEEFFIPSL